jgi:kynurenine formamidase
MDAPAHFVAGGRFTPQLRMRELVLPIVVIDIAKRAARDPDTVVTADDLRRFERKHGRIPDGALVAMDSGWAKKIDDQAAYKGGPPGDYHFPGFGDSAIEFLLERRDAAGIGVDTLSLDNGPSTTFSVHVNWLNADNYGLENLANLDKLPPHGATAIVGVIPWQDGSGGPARVLATY